LRHDVNKNLKWNYTMNNTFCYKRHSSILFHFLYRRNSRW
jgi:hypothetical protein